MLGADAAAGSSISTAWWSKWGRSWSIARPGNKHAPAFADVLIRRPYTLAPADVGETGIIEVLSALPTSYPGQALLTEDQGVLVGVDDCPCGRKGSYFRFAGRIEEAEVRGCGDTFAQAREIR